MQRGHVQAGDRVFAAFGAAVRELRERRQLTQDSLAERADLQRTYVVEVERGRRNVTLRNIARLCEALEVPMAELMQLMEDRLR